MAEAVGRSLSEGIKVTVPHIDILFVIKPYSLVLFSRNLVPFFEIDKVMSRRGIIIVPGPGIGKLSAGIGAPV